MDDMVGHSHKAELLIVDDTLANLHLLSAMLEIDGYRVFEASNGRQALELANSKQPDLILLDVRMPGMDGYAICRELKAEEVTRNIPVIFVSALDEQTDKVLGFAVGGVDYITKPFQAKEILARVETHLTLRNLQRQLESQNQRLLEEIHERKRIENALYRANDELEQRVRERTSALVTANEILNEELQERKRAEEALRKSQAENEALLQQVSKQEAQVREIMTTVPEGVLLLEASGRVIQCNPVAQATIQALLGAQAGDVIQKLGDKALAELLEPPPHGLWHEISVDGRIFEVIARPTEKEADQQRWVMVLRDVTREREVQARSQQQERLASVGQLAAGIAHDFNNILAVILLYTEMALGAPELTPRLRERLLTILQQSKRASDLIQQILDFSRRTVLERCPLDLLPFIKEQVKLMERTLPENITIDFVFSSGAYVVNADVTRMQQAIMNLAVNARDAMPDGGLLHIRLNRIRKGDAIQCVSCGKVEDGEWVSIEVSDTGTGIPKEILPHVFDPFFTTKEHGHGTGLGLSQVFGIIEKHDGHIDVISSPKKGTSFFLYIPALPFKHYEESNTDSRSFIRGRGENLLVVEDEPATRQALIEGLSLLNYHVAGASHGTEALEFLQLHNGGVDLILSDVVMPEMGGIALLHALRESGSPIPVILMTGHPLQNELDLLLNEGLSAWILKPTRLKDLAKLVGETLRQTRFHTTSDRVL